MVLFNTNIVFFSQTIGLFFLNENYDFTWHDLHEKDEFFHIKIQIFNLYFLFKIFEMLKNDNFLFFVLLVTISNFCVETATFSSDSEEKQLMLKTESILKFGANEEDDSLMNVTVTMQSPEPKSKIFVQNNFN